MGLYYLQSRYYNPTMGRFLNADALVSTGQGVLGNNMFAYCRNNPVSYCDPTGYMTDALDGFRQKACTQTRLDGLGAGGAIFGGLLLTGQFVSGAIDFWHTISNFFSPVSKKIDWDCGDNTKNHILKGTNRWHIAGWRRFGIDPDNGNDIENWLLVLKILQEVVDDADRYYQEINKNGSTCTYYVKVFVEEGVQVIVKIWNNLGGTIQQIADAIPYILD